MSVVHFGVNDFSASCDVVFARCFRQARYVREATFGLWSCLVKVVLMAFPVLGSGDDKRQRLCSEVSAVRGVNQRDKAAFEQRAPCPAYSTATMLARDLYGKYTHSHPVPHAIHPRESP